MGGTFKEPIENQQKLLLRYFTGGFFVDFWIYKGAIDTKSGSGLFKQKKLGFRFATPVFIHIP